MVEKEKRYCDECGEELQEDEEQYCDECREDMEQEKTDETMMSVIHTKGIFPSEEDLM